MFLRVDNEVRYRLQVRDRGMDANFDWISFENAEEETIYGHSGVVAECIFDRVSDAMGRHV